MSLNFEDKSECIPINSDENNECNIKSFADLPIELLERIFEHLPYSDLKKSSTVCQKWCQISQLPKFRQNIIVRIQHSEIDPSNLPEEVFQKSTRKFSNLHYGDKSSNYKLCMKTFLKMSNIFEDLEYFKLENITLTFEELCILLNRMRNLKSLSIYNCNFELDTLQNIEEKNLKSIKNTMNNLLCFEFQETSMICYENLKKITNMLMNLEIFKPGFGKMGSYSYSDATTETDILCSIIEKNKTTLKQLHIPMYQNKLPLSAVYQIRNLNLAYLSLDYNYYSPPATLSLDTFLQAHVNLITLVVSISSYKKLDLELIADTMDRLERLEITASCKNIYNFNLMTISKFKKLKVLKALKRPSHSFSSIDLASNMLLRELQIQDMNLTETDIINISERLPNLETLILQRVLLTDAGLQAVIKNLLNLRYLNLENKSNRDSEVTDYGISGFDTSTNAQSGTSIKNLKSLEYLQLSGVKVTSEDCLINNLKFSRIREIFICNSPQKINLTFSKMTMVFENCPKLKKITIR
ncbi:uncharacterized protein LOC129606410 [Condylostylus longicornis]|uniref:uncharacterized protein LOC129606410 n=1 Tax=Condylostylus longicornis TaxID=2530218 RepID=UPI00244E2681|nr:uncharacterized protein LOC129606410 [Condylostylus longicornis]